MLRNRDWKEATKALTIRVNTIRNRNSVSLRNVNAGGISRLTNRRTWKLRKLAWIITLLVGWTTCIYIGNTLTQYYYDSPVESELITVSEYPLTLPSVTICSEDKFNYKRMLKLWEDTGHTIEMPEDAELRLLSDMPLDEIWTKCGYRLEDIVELCYVGPGIKCTDNKGKWTSLFTKYGLCHTISGAMATSSGSLFGFYIRLKLQRHPYGIPIKGITIAMHDELNSPNAFIDGGYYCPIKNQTNGCHTSIQCNFQKKVLIDREECHCNNSNNYDLFRCRDNCFSTFFGQAVGCRLPYMDTPAPLCDTYEKLKYAYDMVHYYYVKGHFDTSTCECPIPCRSRSFLWIADTTLNSDERSVIKIYLEEEITELVAERYIYDLGSLIGDIGGLFGILLGVSFLTFAQLIEIFISLFV